MPSRNGRGPEDDPLSRVMAPPPNETPAERDARLLAEQQAKKVSDEIDEEINQQRQALRRGPKPVKLLLLGQSESGKSTTLKNFQLMNSSKAFRAERASWRAVIQLNVIRNIRLILDVMNEAQAALSSNAAQSNGNPRSMSRPTSPSPRFKDLPPLTPEHLKLKMRLAPLIQVEETLMRKLASGGSPEFDAPRLTSLTNIPPTEHATLNTKEPAVNSTATWKGAFTRLLANARGSIESEHGIDWNDPDDPGVVLHAMGEDMKQLWNDPTIRTLLEVQRLRLQEMAGFFLDSLDRVTELRYIPTDDDILRARIKTLGVSEHNFTLQAGNTLSHAWKIYDVGGQRNLRSAWVPFFDDMDAIIFLAPISCFDQALAEDPSVNRLEDSVLLWKSIVSNPLLAKTTLVLFLNKCDILKEKLDAGMRLADYVVSYGNRPNDFDSASNYLKKKFSAIYKQFSQEPRPFFCHFTSVINTQSTMLVLKAVQDVVLRKNLKDSALLMD